MVTILLIGGSYAYLTLTLNSNKNNILTSGNLNIVLEEEGTTINLEKAYPVSEEEGLKSTPYSFQVINKGTINGRYKLYLSDDEIEDNEERIDNKYVRYSLERENVVIKSGTLDELKDNLLDETSINKGNTNNYNLRLWIDEKADNLAIDKVLSKKLKLETSQIIEGPTDYCYTFDEATGTILGYDATKCGTSVDIPDRINGVEVKRIGDSSHENVMINKGLTHLSIPDTVTFIGTSAFINNQLPDNEAFIYNRNSDGSIDYTSLNSYGGKKRENIVIPSNVVTIATKAFYWSKIKSVVIPSGVKTIRWGAFNNNQLTHIDIPSTVILIEGAAFASNQLPDNEAFIYNRNSDGSINNTSLNSYAGANRTVVVPDQVTIIKGHAFYNTTVTSITLPSNLTTISDYAFYLANYFTTITIPSKVTTIGTRALDGCKSLKKIVNLTGKSFNWEGIINGSGNNSFITGSITGPYGNIDIVNHE